MPASDSAIKKVGVHQLRVGMYLHEITCGWIAHPFLRNRFLIASQAEIAKIVSSGINTVYIDTSKGFDVADAPTRREVRAAIEEEIGSLPPFSSSATVKTSFAEELIRARPIRDEALQLITQLMQDVRMGKAIEMACIEPVVRKMADSIFRNPAALVGLLQIRNKDIYTYIHSVGVCALMIAFCRSAGMDEQTTFEAGIGGLLHDIGKARVVDEILNKPAKLTEEEFTAMKKHPEEGFDILSAVPGIGPIPLDIVLHHHERLNGGGYPRNLSATAISPLAQMAAIADVYDAITSERSYHKPIPPAEALRRIYEWGRFDFDPALVHGFLRCVGIYPVGTLVMLTSGRLGVVTENDETRLLTPKVSVIFNTKTKSYLKPAELDLSGSLGTGGDERIVGYEDPAKWGIDPALFAGLK